MEKTKAPRVKVSDRLKSTDDSAYATIEAQRASREVKTARLRAQRLAHEAEIEKQKASEVTTKRK